MYPTTDQGRTDHIQLIMTHTTLDWQRGQPINHENYLQLKTCYGQFTAHQQLVLCAEHSLACCRKPYLAALDDLINYSRDFWHAQQRQARRVNTPSRLDFFREPGWNPLPLGRKAANWIGFASRLLDGESAAIEAGYAPIRQPEAAELARQLDRLQALQKTYLTAQLQLREARQQLRKARADADWMLRNQVLALRLLYREKHDYERALKRYGYRTRVATDRAQPVLTTVTAETEQTLTELEIETPSEQVASEEQTSEQVLPMSQFVSLLPFALGALPLPGGHHVAEQTYKPIETWAVIGQDRSCDYRRAGPG